MVFSRFRHSLAAIRYSRFTIRIPTQEIDVETLAAILALELGLVGLLEVEQA
ncbi:MAG: hypothetical protein IPM17_09120 [Verrucomicrobia bacterium]|nr:hypothetical protein [Verrucomicrobiota bacterium]